MKIEIWSDVVCPFCYIGKRKLERALEKFPMKNQVEIEWKSFQLNPDEKTNPAIGTLEHLAKSKGWSIEQTRQITQNVVEMAKEQGLQFNFEKAVVANTKNAHRLLQLAKTLGKGSEMKERLLQAYFTEGLNVDDPETLISLGKELGIPQADLDQFVHSEDFSDAVDQDIYESRLLGVRGVPFFVFDRKYGISGAQPDEVFDGTLEKAWMEFSKEKSPITFENGESENSCDIDGENC
ncbi:DsbA family oxidoreductase [Algoriphagus kandeliae]|uniref:DsbA family oxidoreductase n=1 Tax=Algoriphagus kandeliae TaxID=2562278 RepID=A0A4Y9QZ58_9BACT|nr:DsbA family oxidoreductase [Algoriphagus kandeliae]TFV97709.1 DsbA family oxidoreductase [Algoriphagus kandeliae]